MSIEGPSQAAPTDAEIRAATLATDGADTHARVISYYNNSQWTYDLFWMNQRNLAMHHGFWDSSTKNRHEALINVNRSVAEDLQIAPTDICLDAGCGVGGTAIWIAENYGARVVGLTINELQVARAAKHISRRGMTPLVNVELADYCDTGLPDGTFDKAYAIESVCHAHDKSSFFAEALRVLKPGGELAVYDYFLVEAKDADDQQDFETFCEGWAMPRLSTREDFLRDATAAGFADITCRDCTQMILRSTKLIERLARYYTPVDVALNRIGLVSDQDVLGDRASRVEHRLFDEGVLFYGAWHFRKPVDAR